MEEAEEGEGEEEGEVAPSFLGVCVCRECLDRRVRRGRGRVKS